MNFRRMLGGDGAALLVASGLTVAASTEALAKPNFQLPFACGGSLLVQEPARTGRPVRAALLSCGGTDSDQPIRSNARSKIALPSSSPRPSNRVVGRNSGRGPNPS